jgi:hypothetical protein
MDFFQWRLTDWMWSFSVSARRVIFEVVDADGTRRDASIAGFSEDWHRRFTFSPRVYGYVMT